MVSQRAAARHPHGPVCPATDHGGRSPKRLIADPAYRARATIADQYQLPLSEFSSWSTADRDVALGIRQVKSESCDSCGTHPSVTKPALGGHHDAMVAVWKHCRVCEIYAQAEAAGPPDDTKGWHLVIEPNPRAGRNRAPRR